ncbi:MAG: LysE family translocator [Candidatus Competibacteraceae bacterium]|jgi:threonine/homoserine/homoserine lactone efflux protein|nr:LysE family translocator [Candidatus Competibacteraceae bacterium]
MHLIPDSSIVLFFITSLAIILTPGQDMILVMSRSIAQGSKAGVVTAAGISTGLLGHTLLAAFGLGAILQTSEVLFTGLKMLGAAYLVYLGIKMFKASPVNFLVAPQSTPSLQSLFFQGVIANLSNPKIAIFYFAYLPQFVALDAENPTETIVVLGALFGLLTFLIKGPIGYGAGTLSGWLRARPMTQQWLNRISGTVLIGLGIRLAFESRTG